MYFVDYSSEAAPPLPDPEDDEEEGDEIFATDEGASGWLESIGLDKKEFPSLDPRKVKLYPLYNDAIKAHNDPKYSDRRFRTNGVDPDQTAL